jgi:hypothetical protein
MSDVNMLTSGLIEDHLFECRRAYPGRSMDLRNIELYHRHSLRRSHTGGDGEAHRFERVQLPMGTSESCIVSTIVRDRWPLHRDDLYTTGLYLDDLSDKERQLSVKMVDRWILFAHGYELGNHVSRTATI